MGSDDADERARELEQIDDLLQYDYVLNAQGIDTWLKRSSRVS